MKQGQTLYVTLDTTSGNLDPALSLEVIDQMSKDFMNAFTIVGYIIGKDDDYVMGYLKANLREVKK